MSKTVDTLNRPDTPAGSGLGTTSDGTKTWQPGRATRPRVLGGRAVFPSTALAVSAFEQLDLGTGEQEVAADVGPGDAVYFRIVDPSNWWRLRLAGVQQARTSYYTEYEWRGRYAARTPGTSPSSQTHGHGDSLTWSTSATACPHASALQHTHQVWEPFVGYFTASHSHARFECSRTGRTRQQATTSTYIAYRAVLEVCVAETVTEVSTMIPLPVMATRPTRLRVLAMGDRITVQARAGSSLLAEGTTGVWTTHQGGEAAGVGRGGPTWQDASAIDNVEAVALINPPSVPRLVAPAAGVYLDAGEFVTLEHEFSDPDPGDSQTGLRTRVRVDGGAYQWWDGTALVGAEVDVETAETVTVIPPGTLPATAVVQWSKDVRDTQGHWSGYASEELFNMAPPLDFVIVAPGDGEVLASTSAVVQWAPVDGEVFEQLTYRVIAVDRTVADAEGFDLVTSAKLADTGVVASSEEQATIRNLPPQVDIRIFVQLTAVERPPSFWVGRDASVDVRPPPAPTVTAVYDAGSASTLLEGQSRSNLASASQADFAAGVEGWAAGPNTGLSHDVFQGVTQPGTARLEAADDGAVSMVSDQFPAVFGETNASLIMVRDGGVRRQARIRRRYYNDAGGLISEVVGDLVEQLAGSQEPEPEPEPDFAGDLVFSSSPLRTAPADPEGVTFVDPVALFVAPAEGATQVEFFLDGVSKGIDTLAPFDFAGGSVTSASMFDPSTLEPGPHRVTAVVTLAEGGVVTRVKTFLTVGVEAPADYYLAVSETPDRSFTEPLAGLTVNGGQVILLEPADQFVTRVHFWHPHVHPHGPWDGGGWGQGSPSIPADRVDVAAPYDFVDENVDDPELAAPYSTALLDNGDHLFVAGVEVSHPDAADHPDFVPGVATAGGPAGMILTAAAVTVDNAVQSSVPRLLVTTDLGGDPDDIHSWVRLLLTSDLVALEGAVSSVKVDGNAGDPNAIRQWTRHVHLEHLRTNGHPELISQADALAGVKTGSRTRGAPSGSRSTAGSDHIIARAHAGSTANKLNVTAWGPATDIAQALYDDPSIAGKIRVFIIGDYNTTPGDPDSHAWLIAFAKTHPEMLLIESGRLPRESVSTFRGIWRLGDQSGNLGRVAFLDNVVRGKGTRGPGNEFGQVLGDAIPAGNSPAELGPAWKEGDSPSLLYVQSQGIAGIGDLDDPTVPSLGGQYELVDPAWPNYFADRTDISKDDAQRTVAQHRAEFLGILEERLGWYDVAQPQPVGNPKTVLGYFPGNSKDDTIFFRDLEQRTGRQIRFMHHTLGNKPSASGVAGGEMRSGAWAFFDRSNYPNNLYDQERIIPCLIWPMNTTREVSKAARLAEFERVANGQRDDTIDYVLDYIIQAGHTTIRAGVAHESDIWSPTYAQPDCYVDLTLPEIRGTWVPAFRHVAGRILEAIPGAKIEWRNNGGVMTMYRFDTSQHQYEVALREIRDLVHICSTSAYWNGNWSERPRSIKARLDFTWEMSVKYAKDMSIYEWGMSASPSALQPDEPQFITNMFNWIAAHMTGTAANGQQIRMDNVIYFWRHFGSNLDKYPLARARFFQLFGGPA